jgi:hypothetical protein
LNIYSLLRKQLGETESTEKLIQQIRDVQEEKYKDINKAMARVRELHLQYANKGLDAVFINAVFDYLTLYFLHKARIQGGDANAEGVIADLPEICRAYKNRIKQDTFDELGLGDLWDELMEEVTYDDDDDGTSNT